jgi:hypothetical protein
LRTTFDLPDDFMKRAKIAAVERGSTLRDFVAEALRRLLAEQSVPKRKRMTEAPIKLPPRRTCPPWRGSMESKPGERSRPGCALLPFVPARAPRRQFVF